MAKETNQEEELTDEQFQSLSDTDKINVLMDTIKAQNEELNKLTEQTEIERFETMKGKTRIFISEQDHKGWLAEPSVKSAIVSPEDLLSKDLQLSYMDDELAFIYGIKAACSEEWRQLGFMELSKQRMVHLNFKLSLLKSVDGFERVLQTASSSAHIQFRRKGLSFSPEGEEEDPQGQQTTGGGLMTRIRNMRRGNKDYE